MTSVRFASTKPPFPRFFRYGAMRLESEDGGQSMGDSAVSSLSARVTVDLALAKHRFPSKSNLRFEQASVAILRAAGGDAHQPLHRFTGGHKHLHSFIQKPLIFAPARCHSKAPLTALPGPRTTTCRMTLQNRSTVQSLTQFPIKYSKNLESGRGR